MTGLELPALTLITLVGAAFLAGWVDAVVGGGGLIQLPALLIGLPAQTPFAAISGTNKISSAAGTLTASITYVRKVRLNWGHALILIATAGAGSALGAQLARFLPKAWATPMVLVVVLAVGWYTYRRPQLGQATNLKHSGAGEWVRLAGTGLLVGAWDGLIGPGTGTFFIILLVAVIGYGFLEASALSKLANLTTNLAALGVFAWHGQVLWGLGLAMAGANLSGGFLGAHMAVRRGNSFVRKVFMVVVGLLALRLGWDSVAQLWPR